jgi:hypothetical protein
VIRDFSTVCWSLRSEPDVTTGRMFGSEPSRQIQPEPIIGAPKCNAPAARGFALATTCALHTASARLERVGVKPNVTHGM